MIHNNVYYNIIVRDLFVNYKKLKFVLNEMRWNERSYSYYTIISLYHYRKNIIFYCILIDFNHLINYKINKIINSININYKFNNH